MKKSEVLKLVSNEELTKKVLRQIGEKFSFIWENLEDYRDASAGVSGFIYYNETEKFAKKNLQLIYSVLNDFEEEIGEPIKKDNNNILNWLSWFALEFVISELINIKEK